MIVYPDRYYRCVYQRAEAARHPPRLSSDTDSDSDGGWGVSAPHTPTDPESRADRSDVSDADSAELLSLAWLPPHHERAEARAGLACSSERADRLPA